MGIQQFHPLVRKWFEGRFGDATDSQRLGWPHIMAGRHTLIAAPTGSGKTLAAFMVCLDRLCRAWFEGRLEDGIQVVYVSPLKALSNDIERNLQTPLQEIQQLAEQSGDEAVPIRAAVRTGDTPQAARQAMLRHPPHILVTTPESLYLLLTSEKSRQLLKSVETVIVDEIHALARDKRGSHLSLSLERLVNLCDRSPLRIGLSATQRPIDEIARFLVGARSGKIRHVTADCNPAVAPAGDQTALIAESDLAESNLTESDLSELAEPATDRNPHGEPPAVELPAFDSAAPDIRPPTDFGEHDIAVVDIGHMRRLDLAVETPPSELMAVCSHEQWDEIYQQLLGAINAHRSTLIFVNTRRLAERVCHRLAEMLGEESVASHHGSLSRELRLSAEQRLKKGQLKALVATASLEMGIDIGYIDLVCQIGSPRSIATLLQRVGRSGHSLGGLPKGRLFPLTRDELLECMALVRAVKRGDLDRIQIPVAPLDILAQQIVAAVACEDWSEDELFTLCCQSWPYHELSRADFDSIVAILSDGVTATSRRGAYLHRDRIHGRLRARRHARLSALTSGGAIPESADYRVVAQPEETFVGTVDEDFAIESLAGDVFLLGNTSWRIQHVRNGEVAVRDAQGAPPNIPFWFGEAPGRTLELSREVSRLREDVAEQTDTSPTKWVQEECGVDDGAATQAVAYIDSQISAIGLVPTATQIVFERFFDESGGMQLVIHSPLGARINRAWGLALRKRFCRSFDFELQAAATDNGILLSIGPQHSFPIDALFKMIGSHNARHLLEQAVLAAPMFQVRWRWNVTRALAVLRNQGGKKVPPYLQRLRSDDLLASAFPATVGCLENHHGDVEIPDHPLVRQTMHDCLHEAMDLGGWLDLLDDVHEARVHLLARDTREPSPFSYEILNANPYAFLDDAPLEERRTRAVAARRSVDPEEVRDLARLDPQAVRQVREEAFPLVRDTEELHDALSTLLMVPASAQWRDWFDSLVSEGRAAVLQLPDEITAWIAAESWPLLRVVFPESRTEPVISLAPQLDQSWERSAAVVELVQAQMRTCGVTTAVQLAESANLAEVEVAAALEALEGHGTVLRGHFTSHGSDGSDGGDAQGRDPCADGPPAQWCDRRLLARIHRLTLDGLRRRIKPVSAADFMRFLVRRHRLLAGHHWIGAVGLREAIAQLQGFDLPAGAWESRILPGRVADYDRGWLDQLFLTGEVAWGRLRPPRRDEQKRRSTVAINRTVPISLLLRRDLSWTVSAEREFDPSTLSSHGEKVLKTLTEQGALFFQDLVSATQLLSGHLEEGLRELAALGLVTSDAFAAIRDLIDKRRGSRSSRRRPTRGLPAPAGRWSLFPGRFVSHDSAETGAAARASFLENWCRQLLSRYGVVFRDLMTREAAAPTWREVVPVLRRMELRGDIRGGRFIEGVAGEQFAEEAAVSALRATRDEGDTESWIVLSAADPLNLVGIVTPGPRVTAKQANTLILQGGRCVATRQSGRSEFFGDLETALQADMRRALQTGRRCSESHVKSAWSEAGIPARIIQA